MSAAFCKVSTTSLLFQFCILLYFICKPVIVYKKYVVDDDDPFRAPLFPEIGEDISSIRNTMYRNGHRLDPAVLVSFVKHHSMRTDWTLANPEIAGMISGQQLPVGNMEALFACTVHNPDFQKHLEEYIFACFKPSTLVF